MKQSGIYRIRNIVNWKVYVGSARDIEKRLYEHKRLLRLGRHKNRHLQGAWGHYGESAFQFELVEIVDCVGEDYLIAAEQRHIDAARAFDRECGYNVCIIADRRSGVVVSEETRRRIGMAKRGNKNRQGQSPSADVRRRISQKLKGQTLSAETRRKMSEARRGRPKPRGWARRSSVINRKAWTQEKRAEMSARLKVLWSDPERKRAIMDQMRTTRVANVARRA